jgi:N utilization substance protein A
MEYSDDLTGFIKGLFEPINIKGVRIQDNGSEKIAIIEVERKDRKRVIGPGGSRIKLAKKILRRYYPIEKLDIKVT